MQACRPKILVDQLTLSQPWGADYAHQIILAPWDFQTFLRPCSVLRTALVIMNFASAKKTLSAFLITNYIPSPYAFVAY